MAKNWAREYVPALGWWAPVQTSRVSVSGLYSGDNQAPTALSGSLRTYQNNAGTFLGINEQDSSCSSYSDKPQVCWPRSRGKAAWSVTSPTPTTRFTIGFSHLELFVAVSVGLVHPTFKSSEVFNKPQQRVTCERTYATHRTGSASNLPLASIFKRLKRVKSLKTMNRQFIQ